ncbi:MAG TPA: hypothetical protein PJ981_15705 [Accumulibacter sp.]|nr:hypothetical protein [Accumulibacter sp.]
MNTPNCASYAPPDGTIWRMIPNREKHISKEESAAYMRELMARIGRPQVWVADRTGISRRRIQYLLVGSKDFAGETQSVHLTYPEQHILECLAAAGEAFPKK